MNDGQLMLTPKFAWWKSHEFGHHPSHPSITKRAPGSPRGPGGPGPEVSSKTYSKAACSPQEALGIWPVWRATRSVNSFDLAGYIYIYIYIHIYILYNIYIYTCIHIILYMFIYIYIYGYKDTEWDLMMQISRVEKSLISESMAQCAVMLPWIAHSQHVQSRPSRCRSANQFGCTLRRCLDPFASRWRRKGLNLKEPATGLDVGVVDSWLVTSIWMATTSMSYTQCFAILEKGDDPTRWLCKIGPDNFQPFQPTFFSMGSRIGFAF